MELEIPVQLTDLPASLVNHIGSFLTTQRDRVSFALSSHAFDFIYPTHITYTFKENASLEEYLDFFKAISRHLIRSFEVCVDPTMWNCAMEMHSWKDLEFDFVAVYPNTLDKIKACLEIQGAVVRSGFVADIPLVDVTWKENTLSLRAYTMKPLHLPWMHPQNTMTTLELAGNFTHLERLPTTLSILKIRHQCITKESLEMMHHVHTLACEWCTFDDTCVGYAFELSSLTLGIRDLEIIGTHSQIKELTVYVYASLPAVHVLHGLHADVIVSGIADATIESVMTFFNSCFPDARSIQFDQVSVTEV